MPIAFVIRTLRLYELCCDHGLGFLFCQIQHIGFNAVDFILEISSPQRDWHRHFEFEKGPRLKLEMPMPVSLRTRDFEDEIYRVKAYVLYLTEEKTKPMVAAEFV